MITVRHLEWNQNASLKRKSQDISNNAENYAEYLEWICAIYCISSFWTLVHNCESDKMIKDKTVDLKDETVPFNTRPRTLITIRHQIHLKNWMKCL